MNKQPFWQIVLGITVLLGGGYLLYLIVHEIIVSASSFKPEAWGAFATILVAVITIVGGKYFERKKEIEARLRDKKICSIMKSL